MAGHDAERMWAVGNACVKFDSIPRPDRWWTDRWLCVAVRGCVWLCVAVCGCVRLCMAVCGCVWLCVAVRGCTWLAVCVLGGVTDLLQPAHGRQRLIEREAHVLEGRGGLVWVDQVDDHIHHPALCGRTGRGKEWLSGRG